MPSTVSFLFQSPFAGLAPAAESNTILGEGEGMGCSPHNQYQLVGNCTANTKHWPPINRLIMYAQCAARLRRRMSEVRSGLIALSRKERAVVRALIGNAWSLLLLDCRFFLTESE